MRDRLLLQINTAVRRTLPSAAIVHVASIWDAEHELAESERALIARAVEKRRHEFATGRVCARRVLTQLGLGRLPILVGTMREPLWPRDIVGSISHHRQYCVVAAQRRSVFTGIGIDLTDDCPLEEAEASIVCSVHERMRFSAADLSVDPAKIVFSIKESVYKCLFPLVGAMFDFCDVDVELGKHGVARIRLLNSHLFRAVDSHSVHAAFSVSGEHVVTAAWVK